MKESFFFFFFYPGLIVSASLGNDKIDQISIMVSDLFINNKVDHSSFPNYYTCLKCTMNGGLCCKAREAILLQLSGSKAARCSG